MLRKDYAILNAFSLYFLRLFKVVQSPIFFFNDKLLLGLLPSKTFFYERLAWIKNNQIERDFVAYELKNWGKQLKNVIPCCRVLCSFSMHVSMMSRCCDRNIWSVCVQNFSKERRTQTLRTNAEQIIENDGKPHKSCLERVEWIEKIEHAWEFQQHSKIGALLCRIVIFCVSFVPLFGVLEYKTGETTRSDFHFLKRLSGWMDQEYFLWQL